MKRKTLGIAVALAVGMLSGSAFAVSPYGNATQKGSLLVWPKVDATTVIMLTNDFSGDVNMKCYYQSNEGINGVFPAASSPSPYTKKHRQDFSFKVTRNQTIWFDGSGNGNRRQEGQLRRLMGHDLRSQHYRAVQVDAGR